MSLSQAQFTPIAGTDQSLYLGEMRTNQNQVFVSSFLSICRILTVAKTGGTLTLLANGPSLSTEFEADDTNVFIRDRVAISRISAIMENSTPAPIATLESGEVCRNMILNGNYLIFATSQRVSIVPKAGGTVTTLASTSGALLAADAEYGYFIHDLGNENCVGGTEIYRVPLAGGAAVRLAVEPASCRGTSCCGGPLMQDSSALYWIRGDGLAIRRVEK